MVLRDSYSGGTLVPSSRLYALNNANGDVMALVNTAGVVMERYAFDPYGAVTVFDATGAPKSGNASTLGW